MPEPGRRVLITGSAGFLGEATLDYLTASDDSVFVVGVDRVPTRGPHGDTRRFVSVVRDISEPLQDLIDDYSIDTVIHLAFLLQPQRNPEEARKINVDATKNLLESCANTGVSQFIYLSSATVYGAHPGFSRPFTEEDAANPVQGFTYSEHKAEAEQLVLQHGEESGDCAVSILRGCVVMGPNARNFITESLGLRFLPVPAGSNPEMQFLHVQDYCSAVGAVLTHRSRGIYNIAGSGTISWREMIRIAGGRPVPAPTSLLKALTDVTWKLGLQQRSSAVGLNFIRYPWLVSIDKIANELSWQPEHSSQEAVRAWAGSRS